MDPRLVCSRRTLITYSPSSGNVCTAISPPRVPGDRSFVLLNLRRIAADTVGLRASHDARIADGELADVRGRRQVSLQQRRRHSQQARVVVEAVRRVVWRQQRRRVDVKAQQVANRVRVFTAVQPVQRVPAGIGTGRGGTVERAFEMLDQRVLRRRIGPRHARRRHPTGTESAHHLLPHLRVLGGERHIRSIEHDTGGGGRGSGALVVTSGAGPGGCVPVSSVAVVARAGGACGGEAAS